MTPVRTGLPALPAIGVVGSGRMGTALSEALRDLGREVDGPARRGEVPRGDLLLLCVPDSEISTAAAAVAGAAPLIGHTSGASPLSALEPALAAGADGLGLHPLQTLVGGKSSFAGCGCAVAGTSARAIAAATALAQDLGMEPFPIDDDRRAAYHAAASMASNFLVTLEDAAERVAGAAGLEPAVARALLAPLVRRTVDNWAALGPARALTGPAARGDEWTLAAQRIAVAAEAPELAPLFDVLLDRTRVLAARADAGSRVSGRAPAWEPCARSPACVPQ